MSTLDRLDGVTHGTLAGYNAGCRSQGGCPNRGSRTELTCFDATVARRSSLTLSKLPDDAPITKAMIAIPKAPKPASTPARPREAAQPRAATARTSAPRRAPAARPAPKLAAAQPAARRMAELREAGLTFSEISRETGVNPTTAKRLANPSTCPELIRAAIARQILALTLDRAQHILDTRAARSAESDQTLASPRVGAEEVIAHLEALTGTGCTISEISRATGAAFMTIQRLLDPERAPQLVRAETERKILAVTLEEAEQITARRPQKAPRHAARTAAARVDPAPIAAHIQHLTQEGMSATRIARAAHSSYELVLRIINGRLDAVDERHAARILAVTPDGPKPPRPEVHGTDYGWQRGCRADTDCPNFGTADPTCLQFHLEYHRNYRKSRRRSDNEHVPHGTPYRYQLGCRDRAACPGGDDGTTCPDAALAAEWRRRRAEGRPQARPVVSSAAAIAHIEKLRTAGMSINQVIAAAGCGRTAIRMLIYGRDDYQDGRKGPRHGKIPAHIDAAKSARILAVPIPPQNSMLAERKAS